MGQDTQRWPPMATNVKASAEKVAPILNPCDMSFCNNERAPSSTAHSGFLRGLGT